MSFEKDTANAVAILIGALFTAESSTADGVKQLKTDLVAAAREQLKPLMPVVQVAKASTPDNGCAVSPSAAKFEADHDVHIVLNGASGTGKGYLQIVLIEALNNLGFNASALDGEIDALKVKHPVEVIRKKGEARRLGAEPIRMPYVLDRLVSIDEDLSTRLSQLSHIHGVRFTVEPL